MFSLIGCSLIIKNESKKATTNEGDGCNYCFEKKKPCKRVAKVTSAFLNIFLESVGVNLGSIYSVPGTFCTN